MHCHIISHSSVQRITLIQTDHIICTSEGMQLPCGAGQKSSY